MIQSRGTVTSPSLHPIDNQNKKKRTKRQKRQKQKKKTKNGHYYEPRRTKGKYQHNPFAHPSVPQ